MNKQIVEKIKKLRTLKGLNQTEMADRLNLTRSAYQKIESGESFAWAKYLNELMNILDTTPRDFFSDIDSQLVQQNNYEGSVGIGYVVEHLHQENKEVHEKLHQSYEKIIQSKDEQIALLRDLLERR